MKDKGLAQLKDYLFGVVAGIVIVVGLWYGTKAAVDYVRSPPPCQDVSCMP